MALSLMAASTFAQGIAQQQQSQRIGTRPAIKNAVAAKHGIRHDNVDLKSAAQATTYKVKKASDSDTLITETPAGTLYENLYYSSDSYYDTEYYEVSGTACSVVEGDDGYFYIKNPFGNIATNTWLKGEKDDDGYIAVTLPQYMYEEDYYGYIYDYYAYKMVYDESSYGYIIYDGDDQTIRFSWEDSVLTQIDNDYMLGLCYESGSWSGYGDYNIVAKPLNAEPVTLPEGAVTENYIWKYINNYNEEAMEMVRVVIDGDDIYIGDLMDDYYEADLWLKGTISGNTVTVPAMEYLGIEPTLNGHVFASKTDADLYYYDYTEIYGEEYADWNFYYYYCTDFIDEDYVFDYDPETKTLTSSEKMLLNQGCDFVYYYSMMVEPSFEPFEEVAATPADPSFVEFLEYTADYGYGYMDVIIPYTDVDGNFLNTEKMYYNIYIDDELFTMYNDEYLYLDYEELTDIPYDYTEYYDIFIYSSSEHVIYFYTTGFDKIGIQSFYTGGDEVNSSNLVYYIVETGETETVDAGIANIETAGEEANVRYTDLSGRAVSTPAEGIYIKTTTYTDGSKKSVKVVVK